MMKWLRKMVAVFVLLIVISLLAIVGLVMFIDPNQLKPVIMDEVKKRTGYQLHIDGPLSWSFYPRLGVKIEHMTLLAPQEAAPFIELRNVNMATELVQLLRGKGKVQGNIHIADSRFMNLHAENTDVKMSWQDNVLTIRSLKAECYEGTLIATAHGRNLSTLPQWDWDAQFDRVQLKPLLLDLNGKDSKIHLSGTGNVQLKGETQGATRDQILSNLNGSSEFSLENGTIEGLDLNYIVLTADALINKQPIPPVPAVIQTSFTSFTGSMVIKNGVAETNNLLLASPSFTAKGMGKLYLVNQAVNLELQVKSQQSVKTQWEIPVLVTGDITRPNVALDTSELEKLIARQELTKVKEKANDIIKKHVPGKAGKYLQNLLGN